MSRRGNNEGSIVHRRDGRWMGQVSLGRGANGKHQRRYVYGRTRAEVKTKMDQALAETRDGVRPAPADLTVGRWLDIWLQDYAAPSIRPGTWRQYEGMIRVHLKPTIGHRPLAKLQGAEVQHLLNQKVRPIGPLSPRSVEIMYTVLFAALKQAEREGLVSRNVAAFAKKPKKSQPKMRVLTNDEMQRLLAEAAADRLGAAIIFMLGTGLRRGELAALRWEDVDLKNRTIHIAHTVNRVSTPNGPRRTGLSVQEPKTAAGRRSIPLPPSTAGVLTSWRTRQTEERLQLGAAWQNTGLVFTAEEGTMIDPQNINRKLNQLLKRAGIEHIKVHELRHTFATRLLELGVSPKVVQEMLGHATIVQTLDRYSHVLPELKHAAADALEPLLKSR